MHRLGVISDTHCPEFLDQLPATVAPALRGAELILHSGDVGGEGGDATLRELGRIAPVVAVRGDHDRTLQTLPRSRDLLIDGCRIGIVHGNHSHVYEEPLTFLSTVSLGLVGPQPGHARWLRAQFPNADLVVSGHTHRASFDTNARPFLLNPGAVYQVDAPAARQRLARQPTWFEWSWLQVERHRLDRPHPSVAIVEIDGGAVRTEFVWL